MKISTIQEIQDIPLRIFSKNYLDNPKEVQENSLEKERL